MAHKPASRTIADSLTYEQRRKFDTDSGQRATTTTEVSLTKSKQYSDTSLHGGAMSSKNMSHSSKISVVSLSKGGFKKRERKIICDPNPNTFNLKYLQQYEHFNLDFEDEPEYIKVGKNRLIIGAYSDYDLRYVVHENIMKCFNEKNELLNDQYTYFYDYFFPIMYHITCGMIKIVDDSYSEKPSIFTVEDIDGIEFNFPDHIKFTELKNFIICHNKCVALINHYNIYLTHCYNAMYYLFNEGEGINWFDIYDPMSCYFAALEYDEGEVYDRVTDTFHYSRDAPNIYNMDCPNKLCQTENAVPKADTQNKTYQYEYEKYIDEFGKKKTDIIFWLCDHQYNCMRCGTPVGWKRPCYHYDIDHNGDYHQCDWMFFQSINVESTKEYIRDGCTQIDPPHNTFQGKFPEIQSHETYQVKEDYSKYILPFNQKCSIYHKNEKKIKMAEFEYNADRSKLPDDFQVLIKDNKILYNSIIKHRKSIKDQQDIYNTEQFINFVKFTTSTRSDSGFSRSDRADSEILRADSELLQTNSDLLEVIPSE